MYEKPIDSSEAVLRTLDEKFTLVADDRFLYNLQQKNYDIEGIHRFTASLNVGYEYTLKEYERIVKLKDTYNKEYPTEHKRYFSTATRLMSKMNSTLSAYKKIVEGFKPRARRGRARLPKDTMRDQTSLFKGPYSQDVFGWEAYSDKSVKNLLSALNDFLGIAKKSLDACVGIIEEEAAVRANLEQVNALFADSFDRSVSSNRKLIDVLKQDHPDMDHDLVKALEKAEDARQLIASLFHEYTYSDFNYFCACKVISDGRKAGLTPEETRVFGSGNAQKVARVNTLLDHILELAGQRSDLVGWKGMMSGVFAMRLLYWCGWNGSKKADMLHYITRRCEGKIGVVKMGAVQAEKRKLAFMDNREVERLQRAFDSEMDDFVDAVGAVGASACRKE